jgi:hypothetical protein
MSMSEEWDPYSYTISLLLNFYHYPKDYSFPIIVWWCLFSSLHSSFPQYVESKIQNMI